MMSENKFLLKTEDEYPKFYTHLAIDTGWDYNCGCGIDDWLEFITPPKEYPCIGVVNFDEVGTYVTWVYVTDFDLLGIDSAYK